MQNNQEARSALERQIDITIPLAGIEKEAEGRLKRMSRTMKMAGFRPGKVPFKIIAKTHGAQAHSEALSNALEKALGEQIREQKLRIAGRPHITSLDSDDKQVLSFRAVFEVYPEITLGDLSAQKISQPVLDLGAAEVDKTIEVLRKQRMRFVECDRAAEDGDRVVIDFLGRKDGEEFEGGKAEDYVFVVGAGTMLEDFSAAIKGMKAQESKSFDLRFPDDYHAENLAGQTVVFDVTVKRIDAPQLPEFDGEFAEMLGVDDGDLDKLREDIKQNLAREVKRRIQTKVKEQALTALLEVNPIDVPMALVHSEVARMVESAREDLKRRGAKEQADAVEPSWFSEQAERRVRLGLIMAEVVQENKLFAKPEQIKEIVDEMSQSYEEPAELVRWYYAQPERLGQVEAVVIENNVVDWVASKAQTSDSEITFDELMGNTP